MCTVGVVPDPGSLRSMLCNPCGRAGMDPGCIRGSTGMISQSRAQSDYQGDKSYAMNERDLGVERRVVAFLAILPRQPGVGGFREATRRCLELPGACSCR